MAFLEVVINSKIYQIGCEDEEKEYIREMVEDLNKRIKTLKQQNPKFFLNLTEDKLFLYQLLLLLGEIKTLKKKKNKLNSSDNIPNYVKKEVASLDKVINNIKKITVDIEDLVK